MRGLILLRSHRKTIAVIITGSLDLRLCHDVWFKRRDNNRLPLIRTRGSHGARHEPAYETTPRGRLPR